MCYNLFKESLGDDNLKDYFINNRKKLLNKIGNNDAVMLFAGKAPMKIGDENYPFTPDRNFYYLTGIDRENIILIMGKINGNAFERLYIEPDNGQMSRWVGNSMTKEEAHDISGIDDIKLNTEFNSDLRLLDFKNIWIDFTRSPLDFEFTYNGLKNNVKSVKYQEIKLFIDNIKQKI